MKPLDLACEVVGNHPLTPTVFELKFNIDKEIEIKPGQFISIVIPGAGPNGRDLRRAYSIGSAPETRPIELCIKKVEGGPGTTYLHALKPGDTFKAQAPFGDFVYKTPNTRAACFIATGTGLAPFRAMMLSKLYQSAPPRRAFCLFGIQHESELLYQEEILAGADVHWLVAVSRPSENWKGYKGRVTDYMRQHFPASFPWQETDYYLCGNGAMITEVQSILADKGVDKKTIFKEKYY